MAFVLSRMNDHRTLQLPQMLGCFSIVRLLTLTGMSFDSVSFSTIRNVSIVWVLALSGLSFKALYLLAVRCEQLALFLWLRTMIINVMKDTEENDIVLTYLFGQLVSVAFTSSTDEGCHWECYSYIVVCLPVNYFFTFYFVLLVTTSRTRERRLDILSLSLRVI